MGNFWITRKNLNYYKIIKKLVEDSSDCTDTIVDVGGRDTPVATWGNYTNRFVVELVKTKEWENVTYVYQDFLTWTVPTGALLVCCQTLEHLPNEVVKRFAEKLIKQGRKLIVSVPYLWEKGFCKWHLQDPIDLGKLIGWFGCPPKSYEIIKEEDATRRAVAVWP